MKIKFYGHNCYLIKGLTFSVLIDPWLNPKGAYFGSWFQWPLNHHLFDDLRDDFSNNVNRYIYISHEHQDHFDEVTLRKLLSVCSKCIVPEYFDKFLVNRLLKIGFSITELKDSEEFSLSKDASMELMLVDVGCNHDSAALIEENGITFFNQNDCKVFDRLNYIKERKIDYYAVQFSAASWHPACYEMEDHEKRRYSNKKALAKLVAIRNAIEVLQPKYFLPSAGPAVFPFLDYDLSTNESIFIHQDKLDNFLKNTQCEKVYLRPGETHVPNQKYLPILHPSEIELDQLRFEMHCDYNDLPETPVDTDYLIEILQRKLDQIQGLIFEDCPLIIFDWDDLAITIDLNKCQVTKSFSGVHECFESFYLIHAERKFFNLICSEENRWQDLCLSLRPKIRRVPDQFNVFVNIFMNSEINNIRTSFETTINIDSERLTIVSPHTGENFEINRYCPHNAADLKNAEITQDGFIICPRHFWKFSLHDGGTCQVNKMSLDAVKVKNSITLCDGKSIKLTAIDSKYIKNPKNGV